MSKKINRSTDDVIYVYCSKADKQLIKDAAERVVSKLGVSGVSYPVHRFVLNAAVEKARCVLQESPK